MAKTRQMQLSSELDLVTKTRKKEENEMKRRLKSAVSFLLAFVMVFSLLPVAARAEVTAPELNEWAQEKAEALTANKYDQKGPFRLTGSDLYQFTFTKLITDESGKTEVDTVYIILPGVGAVNTDMPDYGQAGSPEKPWSEANPSAIYIAEGVTGIGAHAFENMRNLNKLEIQNSKTLKKVDAYAFNGCDKLTGPIDLSGVTELGESAFNACEQLRSVILSDDLTNIPKDAFNTCGLTSVNIPAKVETIGDGAFANNGLSGDLVLPGTLTTIGDNAFYRYISSSSTGGYTSITIPSSVTSIGENAFSGHKSLETVTLQHTDASTLTIHNGAFGKDTYTAHNYVDDVVVDDGTSQITYHNVTMGTQFLTQNEDVANLLQNEFNCYQGNLKPLEYKETIPATCEKDGYHVYTMTLTGVSTDGKDVTLDTKITIPAVGHNYVKRDNLPATCTYPERTLEECTNVKNDLVETCEQPQIINTAPGGSAALGHDYRVTNVTNPTIAADNGGNTVVTYTCSHYSEVEGENRHDEYPATYAWEIAPTTLTASTSHRLSDLTLPAVTGVGENTITAQLLWDESDTSALLTAGTHKYKVKLDITGTESTFPDYDDPFGNFLITVQVEKEKLDFSDVAFQNATRYTGLNNPDFTVTGMPEGTTITKTEYCKAGESDWTTEKPAEASAANAANYKVRITFTYDDSKYLLDTIPPELQPGDAYKLEEGSDGKSGTITGDYVVRALTADDLTVTAKSGLVYNKNSQKTVTVSGIPGEAKISVTWMEKGEAKTETIDSASLSSYDVAGITNAGSYPITVRVEHDGFDGGFVEKTVTGTIAKQTVTTPKADTGLQPYTPTKEQTGVPDSTTPEIYTVSGNKQINAGTHTAKAVLKDSSNYKWSSGDPAESGTVEITYTIPRRQLKKPTLVQNRHQFINQPIKPLQHLNSELKGEFDTAGTMTAYWGEYGKEYIAYTATQAQMTDAGKYTITITLNNSEDVKNYAWADGAADSFTLEWEITKKQIDAPTVTVSSAVYTGEAYNAADKIHLTAHSGNSDGILTLGSDHTYYTSSSTTSTPMADTPVNAGTYYVLVDFAYEPGLKPDNYQIIGNTRKPFTINKATAQLSFEDPAQTATYTADGTPLQLVTVSGLVEADKDKTSDIASSIRYTYRYSNNPNPNWGSIDPVAIEDPTTHTFTEVGYYQITASWGSGAVSNNYTAADATYNLTINSANNQSITLTPDQADRWTEASDSTPANYTITFGDAATFTVTGKAALDNAPITYAVTDGKDVLALNGNNQSGTMKILKAGEATVTVAAAKTANVAAASVTYTVTVNKATPTVTVVMPKGGSDDNTYGYTGTALAFSAAVKGPGGVTEPVTDGKISYKYYADQAGQTELPSQPTGVGTYWVEAIYSGDDNYTEARSTPVKVTISAAVLDVTVNDAYKDTYDGQFHAAASGLTVKGNGQNITGSANITYATEESGSYTADMPQFKDAGTYTVYYKVTADNYAEKSGSFTVTISPKALTVSGVPASFEKVYDGQTDITTALTGIKVDTGVAGEAIQVSASGTYDNKNVGGGKEVTLTLTLGGVTEWGNYSYNGTPLAEGKLTLTRDTGKITPKEITVTGVDAVDRDYDRTKTVTLTGTAGFAEGSIVTGDTVSVLLKSGASGTVPSKDAAAEAQVVTVVPSDVVELSGTDAGNYRVIAVVTDTASGKIDVTIRKAEVALAVEGAVNGTVTEGYTGQPIVLTAKITDIVFDQALEQGDVEFTFKQNGSPVNEPITVGSYDVTVALKNGTADKYSNFTIQSGSCTLTITNAALRVDAKNYSGTYTGQSHELTKGWTFASSTGNTVSDPEVSFALKQDGESQNPCAAGHWISGDEIKNVSQSGDYWYKVEYESHTDYYSADTVKIAIVPAQLTLSSKLTESKEYDGKDDAAVADPQLSGQQNSEAVTVTAVSAAYDSKDVGTGKAITVTYTVTFGTGVDADNYTADGQVSKNGQTWTVAVTTDTGVITAKSVTVTILDKSKVYDGTAPSVTSIQNADWTVPAGAIIGSDDLGVTLSVTNPDKDVAAYEINGTWTNRNYHVTFEPGEFQIEPRSVKVAIGDTEGVYGDTPDLRTVSLTGDNMVSSENTELFRGFLKTDAKGTSSVGDYDITADNGVHGNYDVTFTPGTYTVSKRPVTVTIDDQQSLYGQEIAQLTWSVTSGSMANGDNLGITLETTAVKGSNVGTYAISEQSRNDAVAANYEVTVKGETPFDVNDNQATYTIDKANLTIAFTNATANASIGGSVDNPLKFTNASNSNELLAGKPDDVVVEYTSDNESIATVDQDTGAVTIISAGDVTITATVTSGGKNFNTGSTASYELRIATAGQGIQVNVQPRTLTYNGTAQELVTSAVLFPTDRAVTIEYSLDGQVYSTGIPTGINAGSYTVYWKASANGYTAVSGSVPVSIAKANPSTGFSSSNVQTTYEEGKVYDSTQFTKLNKAADYDGTITCLSNDTQVARVNNNDLANISINSTGSATISAAFEETENYKAQTVSFTLTVTDSATTIQYTAADYKVEYDGQPHGARITVDSLSVYTIMYSNDGGTSYGLTESPTITDAGTLTIDYQISSPGYTSVFGTQTVTVEAKPITPAMVSGIAASYTYTGQQITVDNTLTVTDGSTLLERDTDYTVEYGANTAVGMNGYVKITGIGNYAGTVEEHFEITAVEASYLSASLDRHFGYYDDSSTNSATITVKHGTHEVTDGVSITVNGPDCTVSGQTITFNAVGVYTIKVEVTGTHTGSFTLYYTLLPKDSGGNFEISGLASNVVTYDGQNHAFTPTVSDTDGTPLTDSDYKLTYSYIPFSGTEITSADYDPDNTEMVEAGLYTITVTGIGNYTGNASVSLLIAQRDLADGVDASIDTGLVFDGSTQEPMVTLTYNNETPGDFTTEYYNNVNAGQAQAVSTAAGSNNNFTGTRVDVFHIAPKSIKSGFTAVADPAEYNYTGKVIVPTVKVTDSAGTALTLNTDFTVAATESAPGDYKATVTGIGNYTGTILVDYTILGDPAEPVTGFELTVSPDEWTYTATPTVTIAVTHDGSPISDYTLSVEKDGKIAASGDATAAIAALVEPGVYTITASGTGAYSGSSDTATVTIHKIQPQLSITATPSSLSGGGTVKLTISGGNLPVGTDLKALLGVSTANGTQVDLTKLTWTEAAGAYTAELTLANANETYTFTLAYLGDDHYASAQDTAVVVTAQQTSGGGGGGGTLPPEEPDDGIADPDDTGVSNWLITGEHIQYLSGYGNSLFGPTENMTRAQAAQMFYNLLKNKDVPVTVSFTDVPADAWYAESVGVLASLGILNGVGDGRYEPSRAITRAEFTAIAMRFAHVDTSGADIFPDVHADDWFYEVVVSAVTYGWINGYADGTFRPNETITRAEVAAIVNRMLGRSADKAYVDAHADELTQFTDVSPYYWAYYDIMEAANAHDHTKKGGTETWKA